MISRRITSLVIAVLMCGILSAQDAESMVNALVKTISEQGIRCSATILGSTPGDVDMSATLEMKGEKYCMVTPESSYWYDGKTLWNGLDIDGNIVEVYMTEPDLDEIAGTNPFVLIRRHEGFKLSAPDARLLRLTAEDQEHGANGILSMDVKYGDNGKPALLSVQMLISEGTTADIKIRIDKFETGGTKESDFVFPKSKWPDAEIIDLRI